MKGFQDRMPHTVVLHLAKVLWLDLEVSFQGASSHWPYSGTLWCWPLHLNIAMYFTALSLIRIQQNPQSTKCRCKMYSNVRKLPSNLTGTCHLDVTGTAGFLHNIIHHRLVILGQNDNQQPVMISVKFGLFCCFIYSKLNSHLQPHMSSNHMSDFASFARVDLGTSNDLGILSMSVFHALLFHQINKLSVSL